MHKTRYILIVSSLILFGCNTTLDCIEGNGILTSSTRTTPGFHSVNVKGSFEVILRRGSEPEIKIEADSNLHSHISTAVNREELVIDSDGCINTSSPLKIIITSPAFRSLELEGSGSITSNELISTDDDGLLELTVDGSGKINLEVFTKMVKSDIDGSGGITLRGTTEGQVVTVEGSGKYLAMELKAAETVVDLSGSGEINVHSTGALTVENSGSGIVRYKGQPAKLSSDITGSGKLVQE